MGLFELSERIRSAPLLAWTGAFAICVTAIMARIALNPVLPTGFQYLTFFPAVILTSFFCGVRPGIAVCVVSGLAAWYWFIQPYRSFALTGPTTIALTFYFIVAAIDIVLVHFVHITVDRLERERADNRELYDQQKTMFKELQHRVANNMQFVSSLLSVQKRNVLRDPTLAADAFDEAQDRLTMISRVHRRLYDPDTVQRSVGRYLDELANDVLQAGGTIPIATKVSAPEIRFDLKELTTLSLLMVEALTNAQKHAFRGRDEGSIFISLKTMGPGHYMLIVADDGVGFGERSEPSPTQSLGQRIMQSLAAQLGGSISYEQDHGTSVMVEFFAAAHRPLSTFTPPAS
ncbi:histidine kinase dimerization/phosphoacceptor domain -containing protein [Fulvimarina sp. MAC3]|uniref:sensor histidine kinase n=1 Tax=Fulvimarina sp. MAC3 TaxID=3148887 RepID=UPI0031FD0EC4